MQIEKYQQAVHVTSMCAQGDEFTHPTVLFLPEEVFFFFFNCTVSAELLSDTCPA